MDNNKFDLCHYILHEFQKGRNVLKTCRNVLKIVSKCTVSVKTYKRYFEIEDFDLFDKLLSQCLSLSDINPRNITLEQNPFWQHWIFQSLNSVQ